LDEYEFRRSIISYGRHRKRTIKSNKSTSSITSKTSLSEESKNEGNKATSNKGNISSSSSNNTNTNTNTNRNTVPRLDVQDRAKILLRSGYTIYEIAQITQEVQNIQRERQKSSTSSSISLSTFSPSKLRDGVTFAIESSGKVIRRLARFEGNTDGTGTTSSTTTKTIVVN
jgi:hypothetical protein